MNQLFHFWIFFAWVVILAFLLFLYFFQPEVFFQLFDYPTNTEGPFNNIPTGN